ncbi:hypothetical protein KM620_gp050 [Hyposidra talaca nucleopolyhedrovirus]|uniref:Ac53 n=1 Tax=Hyposidra talaca nucleopolyhedrovirus TaxID=1070315 RepID=A0A2Z4HHZ0_9ABAC|nr:hypothetical protein KM620_gp050 [Hyposidra talaca nucleopolyhedrovirus]AWW14410.1 hypothetical protein HytaNPV_gp050 [Hyposidra talaca nucleopolyhedrovirus]
MRVAASHLALFVETYTDQRVFGQFPVLIAFVIGKQTATAHAPVVVEHAIVAARFQTKIAHFFGAASVCQFVVQMDFVLPRVENFIFQFCAGRLSIRFGVFHKRSYEFHVSTDTKAFCLRRGSYIMLITINLQDKKAYLYRLFHRLWTECHVECQICFDKITDDGVIIVSDHATLNLEKMFHVNCLQRWYETTNNRARDPFNRPIKYKFNFPPKSMTECSALLDCVKGFIGEQQNDQKFGIEFERVQTLELIDIELDFASLLTY